MPSHPELPVIPQMHHVLSRLVLCLLGLERQLPHPHILKILPIPPDPAQRSPPMPHALGPLRMPPLQLISP